MTMHIVYLRAHDGNPPGTKKFTERSLARRLCRRGWAMPYQDWEKKQAEKAMAAEAEKPEPEPEPNQKKKKPPKRKYKKREKAVTIDE